MAEIITELPSEFLDELELDSHRKNILIDQINRFNYLSEKKIKNKGLIFDSSGKVLFPFGTIIHGTRNCDPEKIVNISKTGILTGQAIGVSEGAETYYCADFHRLPRDMTVEDFNLWFPYKDGRCPFGTLGKNSLAFVIHPDEELEELLSYDCYRVGTENGDLTRTFINFLPLSGNVASSILYGVPSSAISGVVMGDNLLKKREVVEFVSGLFPQSYVISKRGNIIYDPRCVTMDPDEVMELRRQNYLNILKIEELEMQLGYKIGDIDYAKNQYDKLLNAVISTCGVDVTADVLLASGWQGTKESTVRHVEEVKGARK